MKLRKITSLLISIVMMISIMPMGTIQANAVTFNELNSSEVFLKQAGSTTCTLCSATMMMRRYSMLRGDSGWRTITEASVKTTAWINGTGLKWSFSYSNSSVSSISVAHYSLPGGSGNETKIQEELKKCPEGIVIYNQSVPHAVLLTDYKDGVYYCADPLGSSPKGRIPLSQSYKVSIRNVTAYWKVTSPVVSGPSENNHNTHSYTKRYYEPEHPHRISERCSCGAWRWTNEYHTINTCEQCWKVTWHSSKPEINLKVGDSETVNVYISDVVAPEGAKFDTTYDKNIVDCSSENASSGVNYTFKGKAAGKTNFILTVYSDSTLSKKFHHIQYQ